MKFETWSLKMSKTLQQILDEFNEDDQKDIEEYTQKMISEYYFLLYPYGWTYLP